MNRLRANIPNALTVSNLLCGCLGLLAVAESQPQRAVWFMVGGLFFDFFDGLVARLLKVSSPIGADLDSLADMVTFGVLPSFLMVHLLRAEAAPDYLAYGGLFIAAMSAARLAIFNNDPSQSLGFKGVPTPLNAILIGSLLFIRPDYPTWFSWPLLLGLTAVLGLLLISRLPLMALKFKSFAWRHNQLKYTFLLLSAGSVLFLHFLAVPVIFVAYLLVSLINRPSAA